MKVFNSKLYIPIIYLIGLLNWFLDTNYIFLPVFVIILVLVIYFNFPRKYLIPLIIILPFVNKDATQSTFVIICYIMILLLISYDIYKQKYLELNPIIKRMILFLVVMGLSLFYTISPSLTIDGIIKYYVFILILYYFYNNKDENKKAYTVECFMGLGLFIFMQIIVYIISNSGMKYIDILSSLDLGWGSYNLISLMYIILIPISSYYFIEKKTDWSLLFIFFNISMVFIMMTRGSYLTLLLLSIPLLMKIYNDVENKTRIVKQFLLFIIIALLFRLFISTPTKMTSLWFERINNLQISFTNSDLLFDLGIKIFKINPIFGNGANTSSLFLSIYDTKYFPNYIIETLATLGLIGVTVFIMYLLTVLTVASKSKYNYYARYSFIGIMLQGLLEISFYNFAIMVVLSLLLSCLDEKKKGEESVELLIE